jgi:hypothetical protein
MGYHLGIVCVWAGVREADRNQMCAKGIGSGSVRFDGSSGFGKLIEPVCARALGGKGCEKESSLPSAAPRCNWELETRLQSPGSIRLDPTQADSIQLDSIRLGWSFDWSEKPRWLGERGAARTKTTTNISS